MKRQVSISNKLVRTRIRAFTLIELLVVVAIIGILATIVMVNLSSARNKAKVAKAQGDLKAIAQALNLYDNEHGQYPCHDHTWDDSAERTWSAPYMTWPKSPWDTRYHFEADPPRKLWSIDIEAVPTPDAVLLDIAFDGVNNWSSGVLLRYEPQSNDSVSRVQYGAIDNTIPPVAGKNHCSGTTYTEPTS